MDNKAPLAFLALTAVLAFSGLGLYGLASAVGPETPAIPDAALLISSDIHYISPALTDHGAYFEDMIQNSDGKVMDYIEELTDTLLAEVLDRQPAALILSGDLTFNGARQSHTELAQKLEAVVDAGVPVLVIPGNHDLENRNAASFHGPDFTRVDSVTPEDFARIYARCGYEGALSRDTASLSYVYEPEAGLRILMLDVNTPDYVNLAQAETLAWIESQLRDAQSAGARVVAVSHQNVLQHNSLIVSGYLIENAHDLLRLYDKYGVICNLSGHLHCQHIARSDTGFYDIATSSLAVSPNQYGILTLSANAARYDTVAADVAGWAAAQGRTDPALLDFAAYSRDFFRRSGRDASPEDYADLPDGDALAAFIADVNEAYFAGRMDTIDFDDPRFDRLLTEGGFMGAYLSSTRADGPVDMNHLVLY